jgi:hypothetical protein
MAKAKKIRRKLGDLVAIPLGDDTYAFGHVLVEPLMAFYDLRSHDVPALEAITAAPIAFRVCENGAAIEQGLWPVIGNVPPTGDLLVVPAFRKQDPISRKLTIYRAGTETPATKDECAGLECAAVWDWRHVVDRLRDHFAGVPNKWVKSLEFE